MPIASLIALYFIIWWLCLFAVLPFGQKTQSDVGDVFAGSEPGAPVLFRIWPKLVATSIVSAVVLGLVMLALSNPTLQQYWR